ncbi:MAG: hemerythrin domain-containing protein [Acidobacteria bacterium]|nr:hemerythrin domain-containing protein [Acidobacteriota bacterium]
MLRDPSLIPLSHQHQHGLALTVLIDRGLKAQPTQEKAIELAGKVARMADAELLGHFQVEEEVLFPAIRPHLDSGQIVEELIVQHRALEDLIQRVAAAGDNERIPLLTEFGDLLHRHIRIEERQLFQEIQAKLDEDQLARLGKQVDATVQRVCPVTDKLPWE